MSEPRPKLGITTTRQMVTAALSGAVVGYFVITAFDLTGNFPPVVPWTVPALLLVMAIGAWIYSRSLPRRIEEGELSGIEGVRALIVAKSMVMTGAVLAGGHAVYVGRWVGNMEASQPAQRVYMGVATIIASLVLAYAGYVLEKACIVKIDDDGEGGGAEAEPTPGTA